RITRRVYVGAQYRQAGKRKLKQLDINGGVNMRLEFDDAAHGLALPHYCHLPTKDDDAPSLEHLEQGVAFIERVVAGGDSVYIHCAGGIGRAPTMAAAYLISRGASLADAISLIQQARPFISLTPPQLEQLQRFETLHSNTQTDS
ncbi:MAG: dual specificity protein phosphatase family protein, partial [Anaerolineae bacterium]